MIIREATPEEEVAFFGQRDPGMRHLSCAVVDGQPIAMAGVIRDPRYQGSLFEEDGRWIGFLDVREPMTVPWMAVVAIRRFLLEQTEPVIVQWDDALPTAEPLLRALKFQPTAEFIPDFRQPSRKLRIWLWQPSPQ